MLKLNVAVKGERIWYVGPEDHLVGDKTRVLDVKEKVLAPGYIEPHAHPWNLYNPVSLGEEACRLGTTTIVGDNLSYYILMGLEGFEDFMSLLSTTPIKYFWFCRVVPQTPMEREDEIYSVDNLERLLKNPLVQSLGEITRWPELLKGNPRIMEVIERTKRLKKRVDGHTAGAKYEKLNAISRAGVESCHESINAQDVLDRLRLGFYVMLRESSLRPDLVTLLKAVRENRLLTDRLMLTTDGSGPDFHQQFGFTDNLINMAIKEGIDPVSAYRMSTINPAVYFGLDHEIGGIAPGRYADIVILDDLLNPTPERVISKGRIVAESGMLLESFPRVEWGRFFLKSYDLEPTWRAKSLDFKIPCDDERIQFPTIKLVNAVITRTEWVEFGVRDGFLNLEEREGFCYVALFNRQGRWVTNGLLQGFGGDVEGLATTANTAMEILVIGREPEAMSAAVNRMLDIKGGTVLIEKGRIVYEFPLPIGGVMSDLPMSKLAERERELKDVLLSRGYPFNDPTYTLTFLPNDFLPEVRINYKGVFDIKTDETLWPRRDLTPEVSL